MWHVFKALLMFHFHNWLQVALGNQFLVMNFLNFCLCAPLFFMLNKQTNFKVSFLTSYMTRNLEGHI